MEAWPGKTHLMHAIGHEVTTGPRKRVVYLTSEQFTNEVISSIATGAWRVSPQVPDR